MINLEFLTSSNPPEKWLTALGITLAVFIAMFSLRQLLVARMARWVAATETYWDDTLAAVVLATHGATIFAVSIYAGTRILALNDRFGVSVRPPPSFLRDNSR